MVNVYPPFVCALNHDDIPLYLCSFLYLCDVITSPSTGTKLLTACTWNIQGAQWYMVELYTYK